MQSKITVVLIVIKEMRYVVHMPISQCGALLWHLYLQQEVIWLEKSLDLHFSHI